MNDCDTRLDSASFDNGLVELCWSDATRSAFHPIWLRDKSSCDTGAILDVCGGWVSP
jgi:hypothetical protein